MMTTSRSKCVWRKDSCGYMPWINQRKGLFSFSQSRSVYTVLTVVSLLLSVMCGTVSNPRCSEWCCCVSISSAITSLIEPIMLELESINLRQQFTEELTLKSPFSSSDLLKGSFVLIIKQLFAICFTKASSLWTDAVFLRPVTAVEVCFAAVTYQGRWTASCSIDLTRCYEARAGTSEVCCDVSASLLCCFGLLVFKVFVWCQWNSLLRTCSLCVFWPALLFFLCFLSLFPLSPTPLSASLSLSSSFHLRSALCALKWF